jgi:hypothetical protein
MAVLAMAASAYADKEKRDYFGDYRVSAGFVYSEATITPDKARELARAHGVLTLVHVSEVSPAVAEALVIRGGDTVLTLPALATLSTIGDGSGFQCRPVVQHSFTRGIRSRPQFQDLQIWWPAPFLSAVWIVKQLLEPLAERFGVAIEP